MASDLDTPFGQVIEDINTDKSSVWMVTDQVVPLKYSTQSSKIHRASISDFPTQLDGNQIIINTDRFVMNAKTDKIMGHSLSGIHWTTLRDYTVDSDRDHRTWTNRDKSDRVQQDSALIVGRNHLTSTLNDISHIAKRDVILSGNRRLSMIGTKIHIGSISNVAQPLVLGKELQDFLKQMTDIVNNLADAISNIPPLSSTPNTPVNLAPLKSAIAPIKTSLNALKSQYLNSQILSSDNFTVKTNDSPLTTTNIQSYREG